MHSDPLADMLTRLRNAQSARHTSCRMPASKVKKAVLDVMVQQKAIRSVDVEKGEKNELVVQLDPSKKMSFVRESKPGQRKYVGAANISSTKNGLGFSVVSTSQGVMTARSAKAKKIGGEYICSIF